MLAFFSRILYSNFMKIDNHIKTIALYHKFTYIQDILLLFTLKIVFVKSTSV